MDPSPLHPSLLRPPILHILRAAGFTTTRPSVLDTLVDLTSRHLQLLATHTARHALLREPSNTPFPGSITLPDVRMAMQDAGVLYPSKGEMEEEIMGEEDMRGVEGFVGWCLGEGNLEIRRCAGMEGPSSLSAMPNENPSLTTNPNAIANAPSDPTAIDPLDPPPQDYLIALKRKHAKTRDGEEARYAGTVLGRDRDAIEIKIEGWGEVGSLEEWATRLRMATQGKEEGVQVEEMEVEGDDGENRDGGGGSASSSPLSEISGDVGEEVG